MDQAPHEDDKPQRLYFKTYLQMIRNSVGTTMFRNFYVKTQAVGEFDAVQGGDTACAFYVSSILVIFAKIQRIHGTVAGTGEDMEQSGWQPVPDAARPEPGDVIVWGPSAHIDGHKHIGFILGDGRAVSTSSKRCMVQEHDMHFGDEGRPIESVYRFSPWDQQPAS